MKTVIAAAAASLMAAPAMAGPYVNIENNSGFTGTEFDISITETHVGFEGELGEDATWYVQGGTAFVSPDGEDTTTELSGKVGISYDVTEKIEVYGEVYAITAGEVDFDKDASIATKLGATYRF